MKDSDDGLDAFASEAVLFLESHAPRKRSGSAGWGVGDDSVAVFDDRSPEEEQAHTRQATAWRNQLFDAGFGWIDGPIEYGGRELPEEFVACFREVEAQFDVPDTACFGIGLGMVAPTILEHGQESVRARYLRGLYRGDVFACQLFSEPNAGSDLANVQTRAVRDGDGWRVTGQKVWTSFAHQAHIGELLARTSPDQPKHRGLTMFVVDMKADGVTVRPLRQLTGGAEFNEVFFDDVWIPDDHRLGQVDAGWSVALTTLMNERASVGGGAAAPRGEAALFARLVQLAEQFGATRDPVIRQHLTSVHSSMTVLHLTRQRAVARTPGNPPGPEFSIAKLLTSQILGHAAETAMSILGVQGVADTGEWGTFSWGKLLLGAPGFRIGGGTDEVMKNVLAERVLGLPKDPSVQSKGTGATPSSS